MSVLIKDMQMPKNCRECPVALSGKYCRINKTYTTYIELPIRPDHCPLVELPKHHGRLIDADSLMRVYEDRLEKVVNRYGVDSSEAGILSGAMKLLMIELGIIEAEEDE